MAHPEARMSDNTLVFDNLDVDLFIKVALHTIFSPFFTFFVPIIYKGVGYPWTDPLVAWSGAWWMFMVAVCKPYLQFCT